MPEINLKWILFLLVGLIYAYSVSPATYPNSDTFHYMVVAKSFASGNGFRHISSPLNYREDIALPIYPLILVPSFMLFGGSLLAARYTTVLLAVILLYVLHKICRLFLEPRLALAATAVTALSPLFVIYARNALTEIPYTLFALSSLYLVHKTRGSDDVKNRYFAAGVVLAAAAFFTKIFGLVLVASIILYLAKSRRYRKAAVFAVLLILSLGFLYKVNYILLFPDKNTPEGAIRYERLSHPESAAKKFTPGDAAFKLAFMAKQIELFSAKRVGVAASSVVGYFLYLIPSNVFAPLALARTVFFEGVKLSPQVFSVPNMLALVGLAVTAVSFKGLKKSARKGGFTVFHVYVVSLALFLLVFSKVTGNGRYAISILPFFAIFFIQGLEAVLARRKQAFNLLIILMLASSLLLGAALSFKNHARSPPQAKQGYVAALEWLEGNAAAGSVVMSHRVDEAYFHSGLKGVAYPQDDEHFQAALGEHGVDYLLIKDGSWYASEVKASPQKFRLAYSAGEPQVEVYEVA